MVSKLALLSSFLLASAALADTSSQLNAHRRKNVQSQDVQPVESLSNVVSRASENGGYAGAVLNYVLQSWGVFTMVTGTFQVPHIPNGYSGVGPSVSIDNFRCENNASFQVGVEIEVLGEETKCTPWCRWAPANLACNFTGLTIQAGDNVTLLLNLSSATTGLAAITVNGHMSIEEFAVPAAYAVCEQNAGWMIQPIPGLNGVQVPLADFGNLTFTNAFAFGPRVGNLAPRNALITNMVQPGNNSRLTNVSVPQNDLVIQYLSSSLLSGDG